MTDAGIVPRIGAQALLYALFMAFVGYFSFAPDYQSIAAGNAVIRLSFSHGGVRKGGCRRFTTEEIAALPPNERRPMDCARERVPVQVELYLDGELVHEGSLRPSGIARDGPSTLYESFEVSAGEHHLLVRLRDSERETGFDYEREANVTLAPLESLVIDFRAETGGFEFF